MPQGLQVWDASGNLIIDVTTKTGTVIGVSSITASTSGNVVNALFAEGTPFWTLVPQNGNFGVNPIITYNAGLTRLEWDTGADQNMMIVYGVF